MRALAVIGAAWGDEGKGRMVDHFAAILPRPIVVRYSGGAQAAHTVVTPEGRRHIFHHFGSGTLVGAPTYLSRYFIVNPLLWKMEHGELLSGGASPRLYLHPDAPVSTHYDMLINRELERSRGDNRHGSCGYGINETVERFLGGRFRLYAHQLKNPVALREFLLRVKRKHVPARLQQLGIHKPSEWLQESLATDALLEKYLDCAAALLANAMPMRDDQITQWESVIFEGSQGLLLDEQSRFFPHVTRSRTGLPNIGSICVTAGIRDLEAVYTTRAYATRHGSGPFPTEDKAMRFADDTNEPNEFQGTLRFGALDLDLLGEAITLDARNDGGVKVQRSLAITCLDQMQDAIPYQYRGKLQRASRDGLPQVAARILKADKLYVSCSPRRTAKTT